MTGWKRGAEHNDIPEPDKVWYADLDDAPRRVWMIDGANVPRFKLARTPNWTISDPDDVTSEWGIVKGTRRQAPHAGRDEFLGNVWSGIDEHWYMTPYYGSRDDYWKAPPVPQRAPYLSPASM